ncbi:MAG: hypothetical protein ACI8P9_002002 [Parasphingorhabdus sp.]|jgi:hypothetical protein
MGRLVLLFIVLALTGNSATASDLVKFTPIPVKFIAALGDHSANSGTGAEKWGVWHDDPAKRGVWLKLYPVVHAAGGFTPSRWQVDENDWWLEEHGLIMQAPQFPIDPGQYVVTGDREVTTTLTIYPADDTGAMRWELGHNAALFDVTHLPCRSARYQPIEGQVCTPLNADQSEFKVAPGIAMPAVTGCVKQDYAVLFLVGIVVDS